VSLYGTRISLNGKCTVRELASEAKVSLATAKKAIDCYNDGYDYPLKDEREKAVVGSKRLGLQAHHHAFLYSLFDENPKRPRVDKETYAQ
jgi:hypothetical protein